MLFNVVCWFIHVRKPAFTETFNGHLNQNLVKSVNGVPHSFCKLFGGNALVIDHIHFYLAQNLFLNTKYDS